MKNFYLGAGIIFPMALKRLTYQSKQAAQADLLQWVERERSRGARPVVVVRSYEEEVRVKHLLAREGIGFGVAAVTFDGWLEDLWELFGDGRALVSPLQRAVLVRRSLEDEVAAAQTQAQSKGAPAASPLACTPGYAKLLARAAREGFAAARKAAALDMSDSKRAATDAVLRYGELLGERGLVEPTEAWETLAEAGVLAGARVAVLDVDLNALQLRFLGAADAFLFEVEWEEQGAEGRPEELARLQKHLLDPDFENPVRACGHVHFALPSGSYAAPRLVADCLASWCSRHPGGAVALAAPDPAKWFDKLAPRLSGEGVHSSRFGSVPFGQTPFGSAWCALLRFAAQGASGAPLNVRLAGDYALSPFSALSSHMARVADSRFRGARAQTADDALTDLTAFADEEHRDIASAFAEGRYDDALAAERDWVFSQTSWPPAFRNTALAAIDCACAAHETAADAQLSLGALADVLEVQLVPAAKEMMPAVPCEGAEDEGVRGARVEFFTLAELAERPPSSFDCVVLADLTATAYPLTDERDAADALLDVWGCGPEELKALGCLQTNTQRMQKAFSAALATARECLVASRPLHTDEGEEERPSALFEELVDCYRFDPQNIDEVDRVTGLTSALSVYASELGEDDAAANLACGAAPALSREIPCDSIQSVASNARRYILLPRIFAGGVIADQPYLSPSAIESYLECPHLWFSLRRLRLDTLDADFGGLAFGNFAHGVLEQLHAAMPEHGMRRVTEDNAEQAVALMNGIFDERQEIERHRFSKDALIPVNELERLEVEQLRHRLQELVRREARLLPDFAPFKQEMPFGEGDDEFIYAGVHVAGKVDRIDVDAYGRAVVIDYKGSVGKEYAFRADEHDETVLPRKMQTLIYAQMVRRKLGLVPVGALYLSYGKDGMVRGLYDRTILDADRDLLGINAKTCGSSAFLDALDAAEEAVASRIAHLLAGEVSPAAADLKACQYCPVGLCEHRDALAQAHGGGGAM